ncbi:MAG: hypothetical protein SVW57_15155, partial [Thermodesulfobacteriota bacterium]|nr:hypothetical protein [Thermodesulfobacteriota bacterium]
VDNTLAFTFLKPVKGRRVAIIGVGGGVSVYSADVCAIAGLEVPTLSAETLKELRSFIPSSGTMIKNPMDIGLALRDVDIFKRTLDLVAKDPLIDIIMLNYHWFMLRFADVELLNGIKAYLKDFVTEDRYGKPLLAVLESWTFNTEINTNLAIFGAELTDIGIPVYQSHFRASMAMTQFVRYYEKK